MSKYLRVCENCEWCIYNPIENRFAKCLLDDKWKGLFEICPKFKLKTGQHFTFD